MPTLTTKLELGILSECDIRAEYEIDWPKVYINDVSVLLRVWEPMTAQYEETWVEVDINWCDTTELEPLCLEQERDRAEFEHDYCEEHGMFRRGE